MSRDPDSGYVEAQPTTPVGHARQPLFAGFAAPVNKLPPVNDWQL